MRILIATNHSVIVGGIETYLREIVPALRARGHAVALLTSAGGGDAGERVAPDDVPAWHLAGEDRAAAYRAVEGWRPDVAFQHGMASPDDEAAVLERFPTVLFAHGHAATCVSGSRTHMFPSPRPCDKSFGPGCLVHYFPHRCGGLSPVTMLRLYRHARSRNAALGRYAAVAAASRYMIDEYRRNGVPDEKLCLAPLFPTGQVPDAEVRPRPRTDRALYVGRFQPDKGVGLLAETVARASARLGRRLTLVVAGEGPERAAVERGGVRWGVPVELHGWVTPGKRVELMRGADVLVVPSVCPETFGLVGVEAGCAGLPAVGYATGGIPDWLIPGVSGELSPGQRPDSRGLAAALTRALGDDDRLRRLQVGAWETARRYTLERHLRELLPVLRKASGVAT